MSTQLKPVLGPVQLTFYSVGVIIGAGVYSVIGAAAGIAHESIWLGFAIGAAVAMLAGLAYAEMATAFPHAGAEYVYLRRAFPNSDWIAVSVGLVILIGGAATASTVALAFGGYLRVFVDIPVAASAMALLVICTVFNILGMKESSWANIILTSVEVAGLLIVIVAGARQGDMLAPLSAAPHPNVLTAAALLFFVYLGFEEVANLAEEVRNPARDLPRAIFVSIAVTTLLYISVALALVALASPAELAGSAAPLAFAVERVWPGMATLIGAIAVFATANTVLITLIATSRLAYSMSCDGEIPRAFGALLPNRRTPWLAAVLILVACAALIPIGNVRVLAEISSFAALAAFFAVNVALIVLRFRLPEQNRPFRVPLNIGRMPLLPVLAIASICLLLAHFDLSMYIYGSIILLLTIGLFILRRNLSG